MFPSQKQNPAIALGPTPLTAVLFKTAVSQPLLALIKRIPLPVPFQHFSHWSCCSWLSCFQGWNQSHVSRNIIRGKEVKAVYGVTVLMAETRKWQWEHSICFRTKGKTTVNQVNLISYWNRRETFKRRLHLAAQVNRKLNEYNYLQYCN